MKKIALFFVSAAVALMAAGCSVVELEQVGEEETVNDKILVHKSFLAGTVETRTILDGKKVVFTKGESISIFDGSENREFTADEAGSSVSFSGDVSSTATEFYAMSPYSASTVFTKSGSTVTAKTALASAQVATSGSFEDGMNITAAKSDASDQFSLVNVMSVAKFTLASANLGGHSIMSVELSSSYPLAGDVVVTYGETPSAAGGSNTVKKVTIANADGSSLSDGTYYMVVIPNAGGEISMKFTDADGYTATKTATLKSAFEAGSIKNLGTVKGLEWVEPCYKKVTSAPADGDWSGDYLLVYESGSKVLNGISFASSISSTSIGTPTDVTINSDKSISWASYNAYNIAIAKSGKGYTLDLNNNGYLGWESGAGNSLTSTTVETVTSDNYRWALSLDASGNVLIKNLKDSDRTIWYNPSSSRFCAYTSLGDFVKAVQIYKKISEETTPITGPATVTLTTGEAVNVTGSTATLNASFNDLSPLNAQEVGFYWGTDPAALTDMAFDIDFVPQESGTISAVLSSLSGKTTYYYQVTMKVWDRASNSYKEFKGDVKSFTTSEATIPPIAQGWLELPVIAGGEDYVSTFYSGNNRNYSFNYSFSWYASMWVAYPLTSAHTNGSASTNSWSFYSFDLIPEEYQVHVKEKSYPSSYNASAYSKGHQIPKADRKSNQTMNSQTCCVINQTPQLQDKFNASIWSSLEGAARTEASKVDTLYVITGPVYRTVGGNEDITYLSAANNTIIPAQVPVANYYWKAFLKVKRENGIVTDASAIAFWFRHKNYVNGETFDQNNVSQGKPPFFCSVDTVEELIGFDLFTNLPDELEATVEANASWNDFKAFTTK